jgi:GAF domain-containing protein
MMHGRALEPFKIARLGRAVLVVPMNVQKETVGLLVVINREERPFTASELTLLEGVADYASISMANALLFKALEERARSLQQALNDTRQVADTL